MRSDQQSYLTIHTDYEEQPISRTYQYRKVMKPMLERKRRARINRCLDELKELMVCALQSEGENVSKLEKADILELTVRHLHRLRRQHALSLTPEVAYADRFRAGFTHCAAEVSRCLATGVEGTTVDPGVSAKLLEHLGHRIQQLDSPDTPPASPLLSPPLSATPSDYASSEISQPPTSDSSSSVWRPW